MLEKIEQLEAQAKQAIEDWTSATETLAQFYDAMFGYPTGRIIMWAIFWGLFFASALFTFSSWHKLT